MQKKSVLPTDILATIAADVDGSISHEEQRSRMRTGDHLGRTLTPAGEKDVRLLEAETYHDRVLERWYIAALMQHTGHLDS